MKTFLIEQTDRVRVGLRRYRDSSKDTCPVNGAYHNAYTPIGEAPIIWGESGGRRVMMMQPDVPHEDPRWPAQCTCGYGFEPEDHWQVFQEEVYRRGDTGEEMTLREAGPGAMDAVLARAGWTLPRGEVSQWGRVDDRFPGIQLHASGRQRTSVLGSPWRAAGHHGRQERADLRGRRWFHPSP